MKLELIEQIHPSADRVVRVVTIRNSEGTFKRSIQQIAALPEVHAGIPGGYGRKQRQVKVRFIDNVCRRKM